VIGKSVNSGVAISLLSVAVNARLVERDNMPLCSYEPNTRGYRVDENDVAFSDGA